MNYSTDSTKQCIIKIITNLSFFYTVRQCNGNSDTSAALKRYTIMKMAVKPVILNDDIISNFSFLFLLFAHSPYTQYACRSSPLQQVRDQDDIFLNVTQINMKNEFVIMTITAKPLYSQSVSLP